MYHLKECYRGDFEKVLIKKRATLVNLSQSLENYSASGAIDDLSNVMQNFPAAIEVSIYNGGFSIIGCNEQKDLDLVIALRAGFEKVSEIDCILKHKVRPLNEEDNQVIKNILDIINREMKN